MKKYTVGADPELFVRRNNRVVSAHGLIPGTKEEPHAVPNGAVQVDGMALEFNIDPASSRNEFIHNIASVMGSLAYMTKGYELDIVPVARFGSRYIRNQPYEAQELGCEPDFNAYTRGENERPNERAPFRTAAGHIHIGWSEKPLSSHFDQCCEFVKVLDLLVGVPLLKKEPNNERKRLYGQAGAFRPKSYGLEYRVLSNHWLTTPELQAEVYDRVLQASVRFFEEGYRVPESEHARLQEAINTDNLEAIAEVSV